MELNFVQAYPEISRQTLESFPKSILYFYTFVLVRIAELREELRTITIYPI